MVRRGIVAGFRGNGIIRRARVHDPLQEVLTVAYHLVQEGRVRYAVTPQDAVQEQAHVDAEVLVLDPPLTVPPCTAGGLSQDQGDTIAQLGVSRDEKPDLGRHEGSSHGACRLDAHGL
jgi:hypothetical protein